MPIPGKVYPEMPIDVHRYRTGFPGKMLQHSPILPDSSASLHLCVSAFLSGISCPVSLGISGHLWLNLAPPGFVFPLVLCYTKR
jgi:hypothetical protein